MLFSCPVLGGTLAVVLVSDFCLEEEKIQTHKGFKRSLIIRTKRNSMFVLRPNK